MPNVRFLSAFWGNSWIQNILQWNLSLVAILLVSAVWAFQRPARKNRGLDCCKVHNLIGGRLTKGAAQLKLHYCIWTRSNVLYRQGLRQDYTKLVGCSAMHNPQDSPQCAVHSAARGLKGSDAQSTALLSERCQPCGCTQGCLHQLLLSESLRSIAVTYRSVAAKPRCWGPSLKRKSTKTIGWQQEGAAREDEGSKTSSICHQIGQRKSQLLQAESPTFKMVAVTQPASSAC